MLSGNAFSALGRKDDALIVWEQGHANAVKESTDLKQLLELEELLAAAKQNGARLSEDHAVDSDSMTPISSKKAVACEDYVVDSDSSSTLTTDTELEIQCKDTKSETQSKSDDTYKIYIQPSDTMETCNRSNGTFKTGRNVFVTNSVSLDLRLSRGIALVKSFMLPL